MKWRANVQIGSFRYRRYWDTHGPVFFFHQAPYGLPPCDDIEEAYKNHIRHWRNFHRKRFRERLDELKKE